MSSLWWIGVLGGLAVFMGMVLLPTELSHLNEECFTKPQPAILGLEAMDKILCILLPFFDELIKTPFALLVLNNTLGGFLPSFFFMLVEARRRFASLPIKFPAVILLIGQLIGAGAALPMLFYPGFEYSQKKAKNQAGPVNPLTSRLALALVILMAFASQVAISAPASYGIYKPAMLAFQFFPIVFFPLALLPKAGPSVTPSDSAGPLVFGYGILGALSFGMYAASMARFLSETGLLPNLLDPSSLSGWLSALPQGLAKINFSSGPAHALLADTCGNLLFATLIALREHGLLRALKIWGTAPFMSPGYAVARYFQEREAGLASNPAGQAGKKKD